MKHPTYETFLRDVKDHKLEILLDSGVHRHIRCKKPESSVFYFDVVTWPGFLAYSGDMGSYTFWRTEDMLTFFRGDRINPSYWSQKLEAICKTDGYVEYSKDELARHCWDHMRELRGSISAEQRGKIGERIIDEVLVAASLEDAHRRLAKFEVDGEPFFSDTWEWDLTDYSYRFVWCCYAIVHAIGMYDAAKAEVANQPGEAGVA
jgi:hypothetical protein